MDISVFPKKFFIFLFLFIVALLLSNLTGIFFKFCLDHPNVYGLVPLFDFDTEKNIPTLYSSFAIFLSSILLFFITSFYKQAGAPYLSWLVLAILFLFLSVDEVVMFHETIGLAVRKAFNTTGLLFYAWVIPYGIALIIFVMLYLKFLINLPKKIMYLFMLSGIIFVSGAMGFEVFSAQRAELYGRGDLLYSILYTCEEFCEMLGIALFIYTLLTHISEQFKFIKISVNTSNA